MDNHFDVIGSVLPKKDGIAKVTGKEVYASDVEIPDMMYAVVLRSTVAHAEIKSIDTSEAEAMGAVCLVPDDVPQVYYNERIVSIPEKPTVIALFSPEKCVITVKLLLQLPPRPRKKLLQQCRK